MANFTEYYDRNFDPAKEKVRIVEWIREFFEENGKGCTGVVAVSGGKDSSVTAALLKEALGKNRVFGVMLPNGTQSDIDVSRRLVKILDIPFATVNIRACFNGLMEELRENLPGGITEQTVVNLPARLRMAAVYAVSQSMDGRVVNTCNLSEDWVGYATRYGDGAGDFSPLSLLTVQEVRGLGLELGLPEDIVFKTPIDGLSGSTDEDRLGFTYDVLDRYIRTGICEDSEIKASIDEKHRKNVFKLRQMPVYPHQGPVLADQE